MPRVAHRPAASSGSAAPPAARRAACRGPRLLCCTRHRCVQECRWSAAWQVLHWPRRATPSARQSGPRHQMGQEGLATPRFYSSSRILTRAKMAKSSVFSLPMLASMSALGGASRCPPEASTPAPMSAPLCRSRSPARRNAPGPSASKTGRAPDRRTTAI
jgi:hypothetical protein